MANRKDGWHFGQTNIFLLTHNLLPFFFYLISRFGAGAKAPAAESQEDDFAVIILSSQMFFTVG